MVRGTCCVRAVGNASADCKTECEAAATAMGFTCALNCVAEDTCTVDDNGGMTGTVCPAGCQAEVDKTYTACGGCEDFDDTNAEVKTMVEAFGCAGAAHATPALFVALAAVANHFLN